jgi:hypothetical protein
MYEEIKLNSRRRLCQTQAVVEARLLPQPNIVIARVLSIACDGAVTASEIFAGEARYIGRVNFKVLFVDVDGKNHSMDYNADFSDKVADERIAAGLKAHFSASVLDTDILSVNAGEIKLASVVEIKLDADMDEQLRFLSGGGEGIYTHDEPLEYCRLISGGSRTVTLNDVLSDVKISRLLLAESKPVIYKRDTGVDCVTVEGAVITEICGETEDGLLAGYRTVTNFSEEFSAEDARPGDTALTAAAVTPKITLESEEDGRFLSLEYALTVEYSVFAAQSCGAVIDAFSVTNELLTNVQSVDVYQNKLNATVTDRVEGNVTLDVSMPIVDNILAATALRLNITNMPAGDGEATIEGIVSGNIIYYSAEANSKNSVAVELPFSIKTRVDGVEPADELTGRGIVTDAVVKIRRGNEIDIRTGVAIELNACRKCQKCVITELTAGEEREVPDAAISIHIAKSKETLWDVAKALGITPELVLVQNPNLTLPLGGGERIIAYRHLTK